MPSLADSVRFCQSLARRTGKNFYWSFLTLPRQMRQDMCVLYAFMRLTDDIGDQAGLPLFVRRLCLDRWRHLLSVALESKPAFSLPFRDGPPSDDSPAPELTRIENQAAQVFPALAELVSRCNIPDHLLHDVLRGVEWDLDGLYIQTRTDLDQYCYQVAGAVGLCCIHIWGFTGGEARQYAIDCGRAFQMTNILRDLREDADNGRIYLPHEDLDRFRVTRQQLVDGPLDAQLRQLLNHMAVEVKRSYAGALRLLPLLSRPGRRVYAAMLGIYGGLFDEIERRGMDVLAGRIELSCFRKLRAAFLGWIRPEAVMRSLSTRFGSALDPASTPNSCWSAAE
jgi:phytoene synthase